MNKTGPTELVQPIGLTIEKLKSLDGEIAELSEASKGQFVTPKRLAIGGLAPAVLLVLYVGYSFFGSGDDDGFGPSGSSMAQTKETLSQADKLWMAGEKAEAVDLYTSLMYGRAGMMFLHRYNAGDVPRIYNRVINFSSKQAEAK